VVRARTEVLFRIAMAVKGIDGAIELVGGVLLLLVSQTEVQKVITVVVTHDLLGPPDGSLSRHFVAGTAQFASGDRTFAVLYLLLHGAIKVALVIALLRHWLPAYPVAVVVLGAFVVYEIYRATQTGSVLLPLLAVLDILVIALVIREYLALRRERHLSPER
jgi:uncharacterized membrane protein